MEGRIRNVLRTWKHSEEMDRRRLSARMPQGCGRELETVPAQSLRQATTPVGENELLIKGFS